MKLLHIIASVGPAYGGPIEGILRQNDVTRSLNIHREIVTLDPPDADYLRDFPITVHPLGVRRSGNRRTLWSHYGYTPHIVPWLRRNIAKYDCIVVNGLWNYSTLAAAITLPIGKTPYFVFCHGMLDPWFRRQNPAKHAIKQLLWLVSEGRLLSKAKSVFFTTEEERQLSQDVFWGWRYNPKVVGYGTAAPPKKTQDMRTAFEAACPELNAAPYLLFLSRIHPKKGCDNLVEAFSRCAEAAPDLNLVVAGPDQEGWVEQLQNRAAQLGIAHRIHWPGMLRGDAKWGAFYGARAFILPSHQENFGIAVAESLACGTPVLITDKVNIWREVHTGRAGMVAPDTVDGTINLIERYIALSSSELSEMSIAARAVFTERFDVRNTAPQVVEEISTQIHFSRQDTLFAGSPT